MVVIREDAEIIGTPEVREMLKRYEAKFGEFFAYFNYADFPGTKDKRPAQMYKEALEKALESDTPFRMVSHRYDWTDH